MSKKSNTNQTPLDNLHLHKDIIDKLKTLKVSVYSSENKRNPDIIYHCFNFLDNNHDIKSLQEIARGYEIFINRYDSGYIQISWHANDAEKYKTEEIRDVFHQILSLAPNFMSWAKLLSPIKCESQKANFKDIRGHFEHDALRIVSSSTFRKLQNKTQVIPLCNNDLVHNRLTHSIEVASVGKKLARMLADYIWETYIDDNEVALITEAFHCHGYDRNVIKEIFINSIADIVYAACLIHDIGNPPYGHQGEEALNETYQELIESEKYQHILRELSDTCPDLFKIEGNAQTIRLLSSNKNIDLTYATLAASIKYPRLYSEEISIYKKFNIYASEQDIFNNLISNCGLNITHDNEIARHPLVYLVEAADDICYSLFDFEDFVHLGFISQDVYCDTMIEIILPNINAPTAKKTSGNTLQEKRNNYKQNIKSSNFTETTSRLRSQALFQMILNANYAFTKKYEHIMSGNYTIENQLLNKKGKINSLLDIYTSMMETHSTQDEFAKTNSWLKKHSINSGYNNLSVLKNSLGAYEIMCELLKTYMAALHSLDKLKSQMVLLIIPEEYLFEDLRESTSKRNAKSWIDVLSRKQIPEQIRMLNDYLTGLTDNAALQLFKHIKGHEQITIS